MSKKSTLKKILVVKRNKNNSVKKTSITTSRGKHPNKVRTQPPKNHMPPKPRKNNKRLAFGHMIMPKHSAKSTINSKKKKKSSFISIILGKLTRRKLREPEKALVRTSISLEATGNAFAFAFEFEFERAIFRKKWWFLSFLCFGREPWGKQRIEVGETPRLMVYLYESARVFVSFGFLFLLSRKFT